MSNSKGFVYFGENPECGLCFPGTKKNSCYRQVDVNKGAFVAYRKTGNKIAENLPIASYMNHLPFNRK